MNLQGLLEDAIHETLELASLPHEYSVESKLELTVGSRNGESVLRACDEPATLNIRELGRLRSVYSFSMEPLGLILCHDRDLVCFLDALKSELTIEAATAGAERLIVAVGDGYTGRGFLGQPENARIAFADLTKKRTYMLGIVILRSPDSLFEEAERMYESGGSKVEVLASIERALTLNPRLYRAWRRKAYILRELGRRDEALSAAEQSLRVEPTYALGWRCKGAILRDFGEHQLGLDCYIRSLALDPTDPLCWENKGNALSALGRSEEAREAYAEVERIRIRPAKR